MKTILILLFLSFCCINIYSQNWSLTGNAGTNPAIHFLGTTDANSVNFRANNIRAGFLSSSVTSTSFGYNALNGSAMGNYNTAVGYGALRNINGGSSNTSAGYYSLFGNTTGSGNSAYGDYSLKSNTTGNHNISNGFYSLSANTTGNRNIALGVYSLNSNLSGYANFAMGFAALRVNTTGNQNIAFGDSAMLANTTGSFNTSIGAYSLSRNTTGYSNIAFGILSLYYNSTGFNNIAIGKASLNHADGCSDNLAIGNDALNFLTDGNNNIGIGKSAGYNIGNGDSNIVIGMFGLGGGNARKGIAIGHSVLNRNSGYHNIGMGEKALWGESTGSYNVGIGMNALTGGDGGCSRNTSIGTNSGINIGSNGSDKCTFLGFEADANWGGSGLYRTNATAIGNGAIVNASNKIRLGNSAVAVIEGTVAYTVSDERFKQDIKEDIPGIEFIKQLRPVSYRYKAFEMDNFLRGANKNYQQPLNASDYKEAESIVHTGFIAQEVNKLTEEKKYNLQVVKKPANNNDNYSIAYTELIAPMVKALQEQQAMIELLNKQMEELALKMKACNCDCETKIIALKTAGDPAGF